jgi:7-carboxy-7-deazaguanine synthase
VSRRLPVVEVFGPTLQGEGRVIGMRTMFVRLAGCDWSCAWCDSAFTWRAGALAPVEPLEAGQILRRLESLDATCRRVTLSGGNPALHACAELVEALHAARYRVHVETQGSRAPAWLGQVDSVTVSPKGPSSGMAADWSGLDATLQVAEDPDIKIVVFDQADFDYAKEVRRRHPDVPFTLQLGNRVGDDDERSLLERLRWLADLALHDRELGDVRVLPQLHVLLWGNRRGV